MAGLKKGAPARMLVLFLLLAMIAAACGGDSADETTTTTAASGTDEEPTTTAGGEEPTTTAGGGEEPERASITFALTNQRAPQYYSYYLAEELGFYDEEGLDVEIVVVQGSSAAVQQIIGGNVDIGHPSAPATAQGVAQGNCLKQFYSFSHQNVFGLATPADSGIESIEDLAGQTVGVSEPGGGEVPMVRAILAGVGLADGVDYQIQGIGEGGALTMQALENGDAQAYSSSVFDVASIEAAGLPLRQIMPEEFLYFPSVAMVADCDHFEENKDVFARFARAVTKATVWTEGNEEAALEIIMGVEPELFEDEALGTAFWDATQRMNAFPPGMEGSLYGSHNRDGWETYIEFASQGTEEEGALNADAIDLDALLTDEILEAANDFDQDAVRAAAAAYEG